MRRPARRPARAVPRRGPRRPAAGCRSGGPAAPARSAAQSRTVPARASPASARRSATLVRTSGSAVQASTLVASMTGSVRPRCAAATAPSAWSRVSTPPGAGGQPADGDAVSRPIAMSRSPAAAVRAGSTPVAAKRSRTASQGSGVRSRCHTRWLSTPAPRSSSGRSVSTTSHWPPARPEQRLADGQRRHARHDPHRHVGVGELLRPRPLVGTRPDPEHTRQVILAARLVQQRPQDGKRGPGRRHRHSCTRHSTTTCSSRCASRNACSGPSTALAGAPLARVAPARPGPGGGGGRHEMALLARVGAAWAAGREKATRRWRRRSATEPGRAWSRTHRPRESPAAPSAPARRRGRYRHPGSRRRATGRAGPIGTCPPPR